MKKNNDKEYLDKLRHSCAHLVAAAVLDLWPKALPTIGPSIEDGFYYDFDFGDFKISESVFPKIEKRMREIVSKWEKFTRIDVSIHDVKIRFKSNLYKIELAEDFDKKGEKLTLYKSGDFVDFCRGGHIENPKEELKYFKLLSVAGAYWRGSEKNPMLTRIYGTAFPTQKELINYLNQLEEAKKRDHRKLGKELDLFTFSPLVGPGLPLFTPKGTIIRRELENFVRSLQEPLGYQPVTIPHLTKTELYKVSGHWDKYGESMFKFIADEPSEDFAIKPMNCPHHTQIYAAKPRSWRDLPQRYSEVTAVYRNEKAGELLGLTRVYMLTQDDAHVFCTEDQAIEECLKVYSIIRDFYKAFDFAVSMRVRMSLSDPLHPEKYLGDRSLWEKSESMMRKVAEKANLEVFDGIGEAAFYAPKLDFLAKDSLGREWQLATLQLDFNFPERFELEYVDKNGFKKRPVMIHRAILGSTERFMSILIEHFAGAFPVWLSPVQVKVLPITERNIKYGKEVFERLKDEGIRAEIDDRNETLQAKIRDAQLEKVPYMLIVGSKEEKFGNVAVRLRSGDDLGELSLKTFLSRIQEKIDSKALDR